MPKRSLRFAIKDAIASKFDKKVCTILAKTTPNAGLSFNVELAEHCNLNCAGCDHFSPIAEPALVNVDDLTRDFSRMAELFGNRIFQVLLMGGEPLLHPELIDILRISRSAFPRAVINIVTNGLKLPTMPEEFWVACRQNHIAIRPTKYPISLNYAEIELLAQRHQVEYCYYDGGDTVKTLYYRPLDPKGEHFPNQSFLMCLTANRCISLRQGRLYTCTTAANIHKFNQHFNTKLELLPEDSIDIYSAASAEEILEFLAKPIPFCRYCASEQVKKGIPWHQSKRDINEWT